MTLLYADAIMFLVTMLTVAVVKIIEALAVILG